MTFIKKIAKYLNKISSTRVRYGDIENEYQAKL